MVDRLQSNNIWLNHLTEVTAIISTSFHGEGKAGKLIASAVNIKSKDVILKNECRNLTALIAFLFIHLAEEVKSIDKYMTTAHTRVNETDVLYRMYVFRNGIILSF